MNSGIYCFDLKPLFNSLDQLAADNAQGEYYLTDLVSIYRQGKLRVETLSLESPDELRGVNSRVDLSELGAIVRARKNREVMFAGVTLDKVQMFLQRGPASPNGCSVYFLVGDVDQLYEFHRAHGVEIAEDIGDREYAMWQLACARATDDPELAAVATRLFAYFDDPQHSGLSVMGTA